MSNLLASTSHFIGIALDVAVVILLLTFACIGYHHGLLKSLLALCSTFVVFIVGVYFANDFAGLINKIFDFTELIAKSIAPSIEKINPAIYAMTFPSGMSGSQFYNTYIESSGTNKVLKQFFKYALKDQSSKSLQGIKVCDVLAGAIASIIMTVIAGILLFILIKIALNLLSRFFDNIARTRVFGGLNKIFGFVFGATKGLAIVTFFILITICLSFVPKVNKKIYPLIQNDTYVVKVAYNTADNLVGKHLIKSDVISKWINNLWDNRNLGKLSIADKAEEINADFVLVGERYTATFDCEKISKDKKYFRLNKLSQLSSNDTVSLEICLYYDSTDSVNFKLYSTSSLKTEISKDNTSNTTVIKYTNISYTDFIFELSATNGEIPTGMEIFIK